MPKVRTFRLPRAVTDQVGGVLPGLSRASASPMPRRSLIDAAEIVDRLEPVVDDAPPWRRGRSNAESGLARPLPPPVSGLSAMSSEPRQRPGEILGVERLEIVDLLADADEMHRQAVFRGDGDENAAAGGAVELGHDEAGDPGAPAEDLDLVEARSGRWWRRA